MTHTTTVDSQPVPDFAFLSSLPPDRMEVLCGLLWELLDWAMEQREA